MISWKTGFWVRLQGLEMLIGSGIKETQRKKQSRWVIGEGVGPPENSWEKDEMRGKEREFQCSCIHVKRVRRRDAMGKWERIWSWTSCVKELFPGGIKELLKYFGQDVTWANLSFWRNHPDVNEEKRLSKMGRQVSLLLESSWWVIAWSYILLESPGLIVWKHGLFS